MEYMQMTLDDYIQAKNEIKKDIGSLVKGFVRIGWQLTRISMTQAYRQDGYGSIAEFAKAEYGMDSSLTSRFMKVYEKYSIEGDTPELKEQYASFGFSQLTEMLSLTDEERTMFEPDTKREVIRDFKQFKKENDADPDKLLNWNAEPEDDAGKAILQLFKDKPEMMDEFFSSGAWENRDIEKLSEILNPSGNMSCRHKTVFLMIYDYSRGIRVNKFGELPESMTWDDFVKKIDEVFKDAPEPITHETLFGHGEEKEPAEASGAAETQQERADSGNNTAKTQQGNAESDNNAAKTQQGNAESDNNAADRQQDTGQKAAEDEDKPAQEEQIPGQDSIENHPEFMPAPVPDEIGPARVIAPAQKSEPTEEQKYNAEQARIDRETKKKLQEMEDEEKMNHLPSDDGPKIHRIKLASNYYDDVASGKKSFELRKNDRGYRVGHVLDLLEFAEGRHTGRVIRADIVYMLEDYTGLEDGFCILGIRVTEPN